MKIALSRAVTVTWDGRHHVYEPSTTYDLPKQVVSKIREIDRDAVTEIPEPEPAPDVVTASVSEPVTEQADQPSDVAEPEFTVKHEPEPETDAEPDTDINDDTDDAEAAADDKDDADDRAPKPTKKKPGRPARKK